MGFVCSEYLNECPLVADFVAKVENRTTPKISRKSTFGLHCRCSGFQCHYRGPWSILDETIWSLTSPRVKRASGSRNFRSPPQKDFCNKICHELTLTGLIRSPRQRWRRAQRAAPAQGSLPSSR